MFCPSCGSKVNDDSVFCSSCGNKIKKVEESTPVVEQPVQQPVVEQNPAVVPQTVEQTQPAFVQPNIQPVQTPTANSGLKGWQKGVIVGLLSVVLILLVVLAFTSGGGGGSSSIFGSKKYTSRTVMIYLVGSNLESEVFSATADMSQVDPTQIDLANTNILIYTGGTSFWRNYVRNDENAIYKLTANGFEKIESYPKVLMNDGKELTKFLQYGYDHYPADQFNLILYDHGNAYQGAIVDDFDSQGNLITLDTFDKALSNSPFNGKSRKLNSISFRTCLMGNMESAMVFSKYADYMVASEEEIYLGKYIGVFGEAFNGLKASDDEIVAGKRFIQAYRNKLTDPKFNIDYPLTYSIIDLNKFDKMVKEFDKFFSGIDVEKDYYNISRVRNNIYQFPMDPQAHNALDLVDVKELVNQLAKYSSVSPDAFNKAFDEAVIYNDTTINGAHGLTVYFPYSTNAQYRAYNNKIFNSIKNIDTYKAFVKSVESKKSSSTGSNYVAGAANITVAGSNKNEVYYQLSDELYENYSKSVYFLFRRDEEHNNYYHLITNSYDTELTEDKKLKINITDKLVYLKDDGAGDGGYLFNLITNNAGYTTSSASGLFRFYKQDDEIIGKSANAEFGFVDNNGKPTISAIKLKSRDDRIDGGIYDRELFEYITFINARYRILDKQGKVMDIEDWESPATMTGFELKMEELDDSLEYRGMDDGEWYVLFFISDLNGNKYTSELVRVGE